MSLESIRGSLLLIADDLGPPGWRDRRRKHDFAATFAAKGMFELERYLGNWARYRDFLDHKAPPNP